LLHQAALVGAQGVESRKAVGDAVLLVRIMSTRDRPGVKLPIAKASSLRRFGYPCKHADAHHDDCRKNTGETVA
jgi:hypothetical protein